MHHLQTGRWPRSPSRNLCAQIAAAIRCGGKDRLDKDMVTMYVAVAGSLTYDTQIGGKPTVPVGEDSENPTEGRKMHDSARGS
jgi:hypothetical protein